MMRAFEYQEKATPGQLIELWRSLSPIEKRAREMGVDKFMQIVLSASTSYVVSIDGQLAGIAFVWDRRNGRIMCFTKTRYLTEKRKITFARQIGQLLLDIDEAEHRRLEGRAMWPMYFHAPDGDEKSEKWFIKAGCVRCEHGLRCPMKERKVE